MLRPLSVGTAIGTRVLVIRTAEGWPKGLPIRTVTRSLTFRNGRGEHVVLLQSERGPQRLSTCFVEDALCAACAAIHWPNRTETAWAEGERRLDVLTRARRLVDHADRYVARTLAVDAASNACRPTAEEAVRWNALGAIMRAACVPRDGRADDIEAMIDAVHFFSAMLARGPWQAHDELVLAHWEALRTFDWAIEAAHVYLEAGLSDDEADARQAARLAPACGRQP